MLTDVEIVRKSALQPIAEVARAIGLQEEELELYGRHKAKITEKAMRRLSNRQNGKLILVTAVNPTPAGEGKTTVTVGLGQALHRLKKRSAIVLREPSLGPVFGMKGGATGGGYAQIAPAEDINLHFTGDIHAVTAANNLLCAAVDSHLHRGNRLDLDPQRILVKRAMDMNDRALRRILVGRGEANGPEREDGFLISAASEVMAILCLSDHLGDFKRRCGEIVVAYNRAGKPVFAKELKVQGSMAALMKDAINPNLVQTLEGSPCLVHGGPFANIAHGCSSVRATKLALKLADYVVTEAGFGADLGAEKFFDIKCALSGLRPSAAVLVTTVRALKVNGGAQPGDLAREDMDALAFGSANLERHVQNILKFNVPVIVAVNRFETDTPNELGFMEGFCDAIGAAVHFVDCYKKGGEGAVALAEKLVEVADLDENEGRFCPLYRAEQPIQAKLHTIATELYGASGVDYTARAEESIRRIEAMGRGNLPICVAKTQYSFSDDPKLLGAPSGFRITVRDVTLSNGAGFVVALTGDVMTMPGLGAGSALERIDVDLDGFVTGIT